MNIRQFSKLENGVYKIAIHSEDWSELDRQLMTRYGEPTIDLGGSFYLSDPYEEFTLSTDLVRIMTESPFVQSFDSRDYDDAEARALAWKTEIVTRLTAAIETMRAQADTFTQEEVVTV